MNFQAGEPAYRRGSPVGSYGSYLVRDHEVLPGDEGAGTWDVGLPECGDDPVDTSMFFCSV